MESLVVCKLHFFLGDQCLLLRGVLLLFSVMFVGKWAVRLFARREHTCRKIVREKAIFTLGTLQFSLQEECARSFISSDFARSACASGVDWPKIASGT